MRKIYILIGIIVFLVILPFIIWTLTPSKDWQIVIADFKNEQIENSKEGFAWLTTHLKLTKQDVQVVEQANQLEVKDAQIIYIANTDDGNGLQVEQWNAVKKRLNEEDQSMLIAQYNFFNQPTSSEVREDVTQFLNMEWSGWIGKFVDDLSASNSEQIPPAFVEAYEGDWNFKGEGLLLSNELTNEVHVLDQTNFKRAQLAFEPTEMGQSLFSKKSYPNYDGWFEIIEAKNPQDVMAHFTFDLTETGEAMFKALQIPSNFSAVLKQQTRTSIQYYLSGDFNALQEAPSFEKIYGLTTVNQFAYKYGETAFYWNVFVPFIKNAVKDFNQMTVEPLKQVEVTQNARMTTDVFEVKINDTWQPMTIKGVNIGMGKPGAFPGEAAIEYDEYYRWFTQIGEMHANVIRVYTLHPPAFYRALKDYNEQAKEPLYLIHGVWIGEEGLEETLDAYTPELVEEFQNEMINISNVIHGNAIINPRPGHASGTYSSDVSAYVISWIIGIEWYPEMVDHMVTNLYPSMAQFEGKHYKTEDANAFEIWLAEQMEFLFEYELETYNSIRPIAASNWVPTDNLTHPNEPLIQEDLATVDPNHIYTKGLSSEVGMFASYHVYPYYPDFMNYEPKYLAYIDHRGEKNTFAAYLHDLKQSHRLPILISEFGIPASRGLTHESAYGFNQGFTDEVTQGNQLVHLYEDILAENMIGGLAFIWQDEWFKRTWNTMEYDNPDRRPFWSNVQTNEQHFGLLSFDSNKHVIDGNENNGMTRLNDYIEMDYDEAYLYISVKTDETAQDVTLYLDTIEGQGLMQDQSLKFSQDVEFKIIVSRDEEQSRLLVNPAYAMFNYESGIFNARNLAEQQMMDLTQYQPSYLMLHRRMTFSNGRESVGPKYYETGKLKAGTTDVDSEQFNSLTDYNFSNQLMEIRIPWALIQVKDPSKREVAGNLQNGLETSEWIEGIFVAAVIKNSVGEVIGSSVPITEDTLNSFDFYTWDTWQQPTYKERLKKSYYILQKYYETVK